MGIDAPTKDQMGNAGIAATAIGATGVDATRITEKDRPKLQANEAAHRDLDAVHPGKGTGRGTGSDPEHGIAP
jgi:hypothetical protein